MSTQKPVGVSKGTVSRNQGSSAEGINPESRHPGKEKSEGKPEEKENWGLRESAVRERTKTKKIAPSHPWESQMKTPLNQKQARPGRKTKKKGGGENEYELNAGRKTSKQQKRKGRSESLNLLHYKKKEP